MISVSLISLNYAYLIWLYLADHGCYGDVQLGEFSAGVYWRKSPFYVMLTTQQ